MAFPHRNWNSEVREVGTLVWPPHNCASRKDDSAIRERDLLVDAMGGVVPTRRQALWRHVPSACIRFAH
jgi:hypothetical protein